MLHSAHSSTSMPHSTSPPMPSTPPQQLRHSRSQYPIGYAPVMQQPSYDQRLMHPRAQSQWPQSQQHPAQRSAVHPSYILTSNSRPTSAPVRIDSEASDDMSTPSSAMPLTPNNWGSYPGSEEAAHAANGMWRTMVSTSHPPADQSMAKSGYASSLSGSFEEQQHQHYHNQYDMFSSPMMPVRDRHWYEEHNSMLSAPAPISAPAAPRSSNFYPQSAVTLSPSWSADVHDGVSVITDPSRCDSRSPMMHNSPIGAYEAAAASQNAQLASLTGPEKVTKRKRTTNDDPRCQCDICGKHFQRAYNLRAHKETHNPARSQPFACDADGCNKRFVRKTDLSRHVKSVSYIF